MLKEIQIKNFKCLKDTGKLEIKPLTFLVGPNSSGKTSLFQFLLALRQTTQCQDYDYPLILQDYIDLGSFKDLIYKHNESNELEINLLFEGMRGKEIVKRKYSYIFNLLKVRRAGKAGSKIFLKKVSYQGPFVFFEIVKPNDGDKEDPEGTITAILKESKYKNVNIEIGKKPRTQYFVLKFLAPNELIGKEFDCKIGHFFRVMAVKGDIFPPSFYEISIEIEKFFSTLFHIGPLREEPQRVYTGAGIIPKDVGKTGKWSVDALLVETEAQQKAKLWLEKFGIASDISIKELRKGSKRYEIILKDIHTGVDVNLSDVGFGTSQVLPIIIESYIVPDQSTILLEQPEIHLHPRAQAMMGELLADVIRNSKKQFIIETHSDLILAKVCTLVARWDISTDNLIIYYFDPKSTGTDIIKIDINKDGQYENFPVGFFEERYEEAMKKAEIVLGRH